MKWIQTKDRLPEPGIEVIFDGGEVGIIHARVDKFKHPSLIVLDSSGEEDYEDISKYTRWLDESPSSPIGAEEVLKVVSDIFYSPATNGKAEESIAKGVQKVNELMQTHSAQYRDECNRLQKIINQYELQARMPNLQRGRDL